VSDQPKPIAFDGELESARRRRDGRDPAGRRGGAWRPSPDAGDRPGQRPRIPEQHHAGGDGRLYLGLHKATREAAGVAFGDRLHVELAVDTTPRTIDLPQELTAAFDAEPAVRERFDALSFTRRKELASSIAEAKRPETRSRRLDAALAELRNS
jgi:Bacteriocin-protection, YdeI or OmpD-Associated